jgi:hypothetical protein
MNNLREKGIGTTGIFIHESTGPESQENRGLKNSASSIGGTCFQTGGRSGGSGPGQAASPARSFSVLAISAPVIAFSCGKFAALIAAFFLKYQNK